MKSASSYTSSQEAMFSHLLQSYSEIFLMEREGLGLNTISIHTPAVAWSSSNNHCSVVSSSAQPVISPSFHSPFLIIWELFSQEPTLLLGTNREITFPVSNIASTSTTRLLIKVGHVTDCITVLTKSVKAQGNLLNFLLKHKTWFFCPRPCLQESSKLHLNLEGVLHVGGNGAFPADLKALWRVVAESFHNQSYRTRLVLPLHK